MKFQCFQYFRNSGNFPPILNFRKLSNPTLDVQSWKFQLWIDLPSNASIGRPKLALDALAIIIIQSWKLEFCSTINYNVFEIDIFFVTQCKWIGEINHAFAKKKNKVKIDKINIKLNKF